MGNVDSQKKLFQSCARFILGDESGLKLRARPESLAALREVLCASRDVFLALEGRRELDEVRRLLDRKARAAQEFKRQTGITWIL